MLAELARTDAHRFRVLVPDGDATKALRAMTRARESLVRTRVGLAYQLRDQLATFWPGAGKVFCSVDTQIALAFLKPYPTPVDARGLGEQRLAGFLKRHGYPGRKPAGELLERLRGAAEGRTQELEMAARRQIVLALVSALEPIVARISELTIQIRCSLTAHPDGPTFRSLFIAQDSWLCAASMLAEMGDCRDRYPSYRELAADAGQCPVAVESGKAKRAQFRWACDHRLRAAFCTLADSSRRHNPWAADIYHRARARGASHAHASRILGRAWCRVVWQCWRNHTTYDPTQHRALQRHITVTIPTPSGPVIDEAATTRMAGSGLWRPDLTAAPST